MDRRSIIDNHHSDASPKRNSPLVTPHRLVKSFTNETLKNLTRNTSKNKKLKYSNQLTIGRPESVHHKLHVDQNNAIDTIFEKTQNGFLGKGGFGEVFKVATKRDSLYTSGLHLAYKIIDTKKQPNIENEIKILKNCKYKHIVSCWAIQQDKETGLVGILMDLCLGSLRDFISLNTPSNFTQLEAAYVMKSSLKGLNYLHNKNIIHRKRSSFGLSFNF